MAGTMNTTIHTIQPAQLQQLQYTVRQPLDDSWSAPMSYAAAQETAAREPDLQACAILPDGTTTAPAPFSEIYTRAAGPRTPRSLEESLAIRQRANRVHAQRAAALQPDTSTARASKLIIIYILGSLYLAGGGAILYGLFGRFLTTEEAIAYIIVGAAIIVAAILAQRYIKKK